MVHTLSKDNWHFFRVKGEEVVLTLTHPFCDAVVIQSVKPVEDPYQGPYHTPVSNVESDFTILGSWSPLFYARQIHLADSGITVLDPLESYALIYCMSNLFSWIYKDVMNSHFITR